MEFRFQIPQFQNYSPLGRFSLLIAGEQITSEVTVVGF
jgi:hypothetical protein